MNKCDTKICKYLSNNTSTVSIIAVKKKNMYNHYIITCIIICNMSFNYLFLVADKFLRILLTGIIIFIIALKK